MLRRLFEWLDLPRLILLLTGAGLALFLPLSDPDYFWHLATGRHMVESGALPTADPFSYTFAGRPWVAHEWLFELLLYGAHEQLGPFGPRLLSALLVVGTLAVTYAGARRLLPDSAAPLLLLGAALIPLAPFIAPRPQLVTFALFALTLHLLLGFKLFGRERPLWLLPLLMPVWANSHGGYLVGLALLLIFCGSEWLRWWVAVRPAAQTRDQLRRLTLITLATGLASLINPWGVAYLRYPFEVLGLDAVRAIQEWQSPDFHAGRFQIYLLLLFTALLAQSLRRRRADITEWALLTVFVLAGFVSARHLPLAILTLVPLTAVALREGAALELAELHSRLAHRFRPLSALRGRELGGSEQRLNWGLLGLSAAAAALLHPAWQAKAERELARRMPVAASAFIEREKVGGRMFNTYHYGGYLIHRLHPRQAVFIDGRADLYGDTFFREYNAIYTGSHDALQRFDAHAFDYVVCERDAPIRQLLLARGDFRLAFDDGSSSVLLRRGS